MRTYKIVRFHFDENHPDNRKVIQTGLTLEQAQAVCKHPSTKGDGWFDGYEDEQPGLATNEQAAEFVRGIGGIEWAKED